MKEITIIYTVQITDILKVPDDTMAICGNKEARMRELAKRMETQFGFNDVIMTGLKAFEREVADD